MSAALELPFHRPAAEVLWDPARFKFLLVGRRGGKTTTFIEDCLKSIPSCPDGGEIFFIGPTNSHAMELYWDALCDRMAETGYHYRALISKQCIRMSRRRKVYVIGAEKIKRIRGHKVFRCYGDEVAYFETPLKDVWRAVRPALSDLHGHAYFGTTPNGKGTDAYQFYMELMKDDRFKFFSWNSTDNPFLDPSEIEEAKKDLDEKSFRQEYMATWESFSGLAYYNFDEKIHMKRCAKFNHDVPLQMMLDFNVNPTSLLLGEHYSDANVKSKTYVRKEYSRKNSSTEKTVENFCEDFADKKALFREMPIQIFGDSSGNNRSSPTGWADYQALKAVLDKHGFEYQMCVPGRNPPVIDRVKYLNGWLQNAHGQHRIEVDPDCSELILDLSSQELDGRHPSDKGNRGHKADALGYHVWWKQVVGDRKGTATIEL